MALPLSAGNVTLTSNVSHLTNLLAKALAKLPEDLEIACTKGDLNKVSTYFHDTEISQRQETIDAIAIMSVQHDQIQVLEFCLRNGAAITVSLACNVLDRHSVPMYRALLAAGLDVNADFHHAGDALTRAVFRNDLEMVSLVLSLGADLHSDRLWGYRYGPMAISGLFASIDIYRLMISYGAVVKGSLALHIACRAGRIDLVQHLLDEGADVNEIPPSDHDLTFPTSYELGPPIHYAADHRKLEVVKFLLDHGADATLCDRAGKTIMERSRKDNANWEDLEVLLESRGIPH
jgi:ankyrin repeat protein